MRLITLALQVEARFAGDPKQLCAELRSLARSSLDRGMVPVALHCLAAATRHGCPAAARELAAAAAAATGRWAGALYCFSAGQEQGNPALLLEAATGAALLGNELLCNNAAQAALQLLEGRADGDSREQLRSARRLEQSSFRKLRQANSIQARMAALSPFEADLARRAAGTATRREMSEDLHLSPRTIDWHLGKIFHKLHVSGRSELGEALR
ncbi:LuxR C-terminal-related transcriptional regulator [Arthrobacter sp. ATA002]|uniref:LuxR C-terminal-related transcriptional regulator n=1 Tax=Arthrobacter sp. ATA002 TaxID=2991715 RepID=UPI0022A68A03|nr:LuxR C-terminal-related transcriptional regulator [Arthrobacter sp. ATA002]WAP51179.1 LuxR C-terminal-related transcriptional regulator [Arthrobacter sp. ATA002]